MKEKKTRKSLNYIIQNEPNTIKAFVAKEALLRNNIESFFHSLTKRGCISGIICTLNHYEQTHKFFDFYYDEIEKLRMEFEKQTGTPVKLEYDLKTVLSWFAFEQTACQLISELEIFDGGFENE